MRILLSTGGLVIAACLIPLQLPSSGAAAAAAAGAPVDVAITRAGEAISVGIAAPHGLRFAARREGVEAHFDLMLTALTEDERLVAARLGAFGERGLAVALAIEAGSETRYRWLYTSGDPLRGELVTDMAAGAPGGTGPQAPWMFSAPLFTSTGERYRLVDIHNPGGDSLELTFRRGDLQGVRDRAAGLSVDERILHDICPIPGAGAPGSIATLVAVEGVAAL
jgi:hypothetical protein